MLEALVYTEINCKYIKSFDKNIKYTKKPMHKSVTVDTIKEHGRYNVLDGRLICYL